MNDKEEWPKQEGVGEEGVLLLMHNSDKRRGIRDDQEANVGHMSWQGLEVSLHLCSGVSEELWLIDSWTQANHTYKQMEICTNSMGTKKPQQIMC